jgi:phage baseplate assembly protein W
MPIPQTIRVNPLDLQKNIAIGVSLPFDKPFTSTYTTKNQIKSNLINLLLTTRGERLMNPLFGTGLREFLFEGITELNIGNLKLDLINSINMFIPEISVVNIDITPSYDSNSIELNLSYLLNISNTPDQVTVQFQ